MHPLLGGEKEKMCLVEKVIEALGQQKPKENPIETDDLQKKIAEEISAIAKLATEENKKITIKTPDGKWISISPASIKVGEGTMAYSQITRIPPNSDSEYLQAVLTEKFRKESHLFGIIKSFFVKPEIITDNILSTINF